MARRKRGSPINGWVVLDKPLHMTSTQAVGTIRRLFDAQKAGHAGTLDPLATGILPIALGEATKTVPFVVDGQKAYRFTVRFGAETPTDDAESAPVKTSDRRPTREEILAALPTFEGVIQQTPPQFSAIKIDGERAYDLARAGETVDLQPREVEIDRLALVAQPDADTIVLEAECGRGTYVRAIARDLGRLLGCYGHVIALRRTRVGDFNEANAVTFDVLKSIGEGATPAEISAYLQPVELALRDLVEIKVDGNDAGRLAMGKAILMRGRDAPIAAGEAYAMCKGRLVALGDIECGEFRPSRVFNLD